MQGGFGLVGIGRDVCGARRLVMTPGRKVIEANGGVPAEHTAAKLRYWVPTGPASSCGLDG